MRGDFSHHFYKTQSITRERFDELAALRLENTGKVTGAFEIDLDAGWCSALNLADGWQTFKIKDVSTAAYHADRPRSIQRGEQWRKLVDYLYGRDIEPQTFGPVETRGIRPLMEGDLSFSDEIVLSGHELNFKYASSTMRPDGRFLGRWWTAQNRGMGWISSVITMPHGRTLAAVFPLRYTAMMDWNRDLSAIPWGKKNGRFCENRWKRTASAGPGKR